MKTIKSEFIKKGLVKSEPPKLEEFLGGEIGYTRAADIGDMAQAIYRRPHHEPMKRPRHGRTKILEVKRIMEAKRIHRNNAGIKILDFLYKQSGNWSTFNFIHQNLGISKGTMSGFLSTAAAAGILETRKVKDGRANEYRLTDKTLPAEAAYLKYRASATMASKMHKEPKQQLEPQKARPQLDLAQTLRVIVEGNITITFKVN